MKLQAEMAEAEKFEEAMRLAKGIEDVRWRSWALSEIAEMMAKAGKFEEAKKVADEIEDA